MYILLCVGVFEILEHMQELGVTPDIDTMADYVLPHVSLADPQMAVHKLQDYGLSVSMVLSPMLAVLLTTGHIEMDVKLCEYILWLCTPNMLKGKTGIM
jgi:hypothetical protein